MAPFRPVNVIACLRNGHIGRGQSFPRLWSGLTLIILALTVSACSSAATAKTSTPTIPSSHVTLTPVPPPTSTPVPQPTDTPEPTIKYGWYTVKLSGLTEAGTYHFSGQAALVLIPRAYLHPVDFCFATAGVTEVATDYANGGIYIESNTKCYGVFGGGATGAGALAAVDDGSITTSAQANSITITWHPDPSHCCSFNLSPNMFDSNQTYFTDRGVITLTFYYDGSVSGSIGLGGCPLAPYCVAPATYAASFSGVFSHP